MKGYEALTVERCGTCIHFRRHYIRIGEEHYNPIAYGHCVYPRSKKRRDEEHCPRWCPAATERSGNG